MWLVTTAPPCSDSHPRVDAGNDVPSQRAEQNIVVSNVQATVADLCPDVVRGDTHSATHSYAVISAPVGALINQATLPTTEAGLRRAREWIGRRTDGELDRVLIAAEGTGSSGAVLADALTDVGYRIIEAPHPR